MTEPSGLKSEHTRQNSSKGGVFKKILWKIGRVQMSRYVFYQKESLKLIH